MSAAQHQISVQPTSPSRLLPSDSATDRGLAVSFGQPFRDIIVAPQRPDDGLLADTFYLLVASVFSWHVLKVLLLNSHCQWLPTNAANHLCFHGFIRADLLFSIKDYRRKLCAPYPQTQCQTGRLRPEKKTAGV